MSASGISAWASMPRPSSTCGRHRSEGQGVRRDASGIGRMTSGPVAAAVPARRATIREVAEAAGVSRSTASRALTGHGYVAPQVRDRVRAVALDLGYVPDATARHLRRQASQSIGVLLSDLNNPFYAGLAAGISQ